MPSAPLCEYVTTGRPHDPRRSTQFRTAASCVWITSSSVLDCGSPAAPTPTATSLVSPSGMRTPEPPWDAYGIGPSPHATGAAASTAKASAPAAAKRRNISNLLGRLYLLRGCGAPRSLRGKHVQLPRPCVDVQPRLAALPLHREGLSVQGHGQPAQRSLILCGPGQPDAVRDGANGVERV